MLNFLYVFHTICNKSYSSFASGIAEAPFAFSSYVRCWKVAYVMNYSSWFLSELYKLSWEKHDSVIFSRHIGHDNLARVFCCTAILDFEHFINKLTWPCIWLSTHNYRRYAGFPVGSYRDLEKRYLRPVHFVLDFNVWIQGNVHARCSHWLGINAVGLYILLRKERHDLAQANGDAGHSRPLVTFSESTKPSINETELTFSTAHWTRNGYRRLGASWVTFSNCTYCTHNFWGLIWDLANLVL